MCDRRTLVPIPDHLADYRVYARANSVEYAVDAAGRECFAIDECIAPALRAVWAAGFRTLGCCCGHGQKSGGIITLDTMHGKPTTETQERYATIHAESVASERVGGVRGVGGEPRQRGSGLAEGAGSTADRLAPIVPSPPTLCDVSGRAFRAEPDVDEHERCHNPKCGCRAPESVEGQEG